MKSVLTNHIGNWNIEDVRGDMIEVFKTLKGFYKVSGSIVFTVSCSGLRGHYLKLFKNHCSYYKVNLVFLTELWSTGI
jgi:hypothetical protein